MVLNGATAAGSQFDQVQVTGAATLADATLSIASLGFTPSNGQAITVLTATTVSGTFDGGSGAIVTAPNGTQFQVSYTGTAMTLTHITDDVWVDDNWVDGGRPGGPLTSGDTVAVPSGETVPGSPGTLTYGINAFSTIQSGVITAKILVWLAAILVPAESLPLIACDCVSAGPQVLLRRQSGVCGAAPMLLLWQWAVPLLLQGPPGVARRTLPVHGKQAGSPTLLRCRATRGRTVRNHRRPCSPAR